MRPLRFFGVATVALCLLGGCDDDTDLLPIGASDGPGATGRGPGGGPAPDGPLAPASQCVAGASHVGIGGVGLETARSKDGAGLNRTRMKPYGVLAAELQRVTGVVPASLAKAASTFGDAPARWTDEPKPTALAMASLYEIAFDACLDVVAKRSDLTAAPTAETAPGACASFMRTFWSRVPSKDQIDACATFAVSGTAKEPTASRRWAYACASVLSAEGFALY